MAGIPESIGISEMLTLPAGAIGIYFAVKVLWPFFQGIQQRATAENRLVDNLSKERDLYLTKWEEAEKRIDDLFEKLQKAQTDLSAVGLKYEMANERINALTALLKKNGMPDEN